MPYRKRRRGGGEGKKKRKEGDEKHLTEEERAAHKLSLMQSAPFERYYKAMGIIEEGEWDAFINTLRQPLCASVRLAATDPATPAIRKKLEDPFDGATVMLDGKALKAAEKLPWFPNENGWQFKFTRQDLRHSPDLKKLHQYILSQTNAGSLTRQEAVSMIPPLLLDVQPDHFVLDACAAPGSKTSQLLDALHSKTLETGIPPTGMVLANDVDNNRASMLIHQLKRCSSPNLLVTCHDATLLPTMTPTPRREKYVGFFDRVLCDVPCTGDGTFRKNLMAWSRWSIGNAQGLHPLQFKCAERGMWHTKLGGYIVYSTCSMNPIENEAVVAELLRVHKGALELVDVSDRLPGLKRRPGLSSWPVIDRTFHAHTEKPSREKMTEYRLRNSFFPPTAEEAAWMNLHHCLRLIPHDQDTGGFFVSLFRKTALFDLNHGKVGLAPAEVSSSADGAGAGAGAGAAATAPTPTPTAGDATSAETAPKATKETAPGAAETDEAAEAKAADDEAELAPTLKKSRKELREDEKAARELSETFFTVSDSIWAGLTGRYGLKGIAQHNIIGRGHSPRTLYYIHDSLQPLITPPSTPGKPRRLSIMSAGVRMFEQTHSKSSTSPATYRVTQDGVCIMVDHLDDSVKIEVSREVFVRLLEMNPKGEEASKIDVAFGEACKAAGGSNLVVILRDSDRVGTALPPMVLTGYMGSSTFSVTAKRDMAESMLDALRDAYGLVAPAPTAGAAAGVAAPAADAATGAATGTAAAAAPAPVAADAAAPAVEEASASK